MAKLVQYKPGLGEIIIACAILAAGIFAAGFVMLFVLWGWEALGGHPSFGALLQYFALMYGGGLAVFGIAAGIVANILTDKATGALLGVLCFGMGGLSAGIVATLATVGSSLSLGNLLLALIFGTAVGGVFFGYFVRNRSAER